MSILIWIVVAFSAAVVANQFRNHDALLNFLASIVGAVTVGGGYALLMKEPSESIFNAITKVTWQNSIASVVGSIVLVTAAEILVYKNQTSHHGST